MSETIGRDIATDELHRVVDRHSRGDRATWAVDIHVDVSFAVFELQVQQLGDDTIRDIIIDRASQKDNAVTQQTAVDVHRPLFAAIFFDDIGNE